MYQNQILLWIMAARIAIVRFEDGFVLYGWYSLVTKTIARSLVALGEKDRARLLSAAGDFERMDAFETIHREQHHCLSIEQQHLFEESSEKLYQTGIDAERVEIEIPSIIHWESKANRFHSYITGPDSPESEYEYAGQQGRAEQRDNDGQVTVDAPPSKHRKLLKVASGIGIAAFLIAHFIK